MFTRRKNVGSNIGAARPKNRLLRLLRSSDVFQGSLTSPENTDREDAYSVDPRIIGNATREFEHQNAKALLAFQDSRRFY